MGYVALELSENYRMQFPFVKNPGFKEEKEWREVVCSTIGHYNIPSSENILFSKVKYRTANNKLIPYIEMNFERVKQSIIKEIFIGSKSEVEIEDIVNFLSFYGYYDSIEGDIILSNQLLSKNQAQRIDEKCIDKRKLLCICE